MLRIVRKKRILVVSGCITCIIEDGKMHMEYNLEVPTKANRIPNQRR